MNNRKISRCKHGEQEFAIACVHVCRAIDSGDLVGFYWASDVDGPRPDAWCQACERWSIDHPNATIEEWMKVADFKFVCVCCWDEAKQLLYSPS